MLKSIVKRLRGALGLGVFGAVTFLGFGSFVRVLISLFYDSPLRLGASLAPLALTGFVAGLLTSVGILVSARGRRPLSTTKVLLLGIPIAVPIVGFVMWDFVSLSATSLLAISLLTVLVGTAIGVVGAAALKVAEAVPDTRERLGGAAIQDALEDGSARGAVPPSHAEPN